MQFGDATDNNQRRRLDAGLKYPLGKGAQCGEYSLLIRLCAVANHRRRRHRWQAVIDQLAVDFGKGADPHVKAEGLVGSGKCGPIEVDRTILEVTGDKGDRLGMISMGQREAGIGGTT